MTKLEIEAIEEVKDYLVECWEIAKNDEQNGYGQEGEVAKIDDLYIRLEDIINKRED